MAAEAGEQLRFGPMTNDAGTVCRLSDLRLFLCSRLGADTTKPTQVFSSELNFSRAVIPNSLNSCGASVLSIDLLEIYDKFIFKQYS